MCPLAAPFCPQHTYSRNQETLESGSLVTRAADVGVDNVGVGVGKTTWDTGASSGIRQD